MKSKIIVLVSVTKTFMIAQSFAHELSRTLAASGYMQGSHKQALPPTVVATVVCLCVHTSHSNVVSFGSIVTVGLTNLTVLANHKLLISQVNILYCRWMCYKHTYCNVVLLVQELNRPGLQALLLLLLAIN